MAKNKHKLGRGLVAALIFGTGLTVSAQINSPEASGYLSRGLEMYKIGNYNGCIDQLSAVNPSWLSDSEKETLDWTLAMAAYHTSGHASIAHFRTFLAKYPESTLRNQARLRIADCLLSVNYAEALRAYVAIDPATLPADLAEELKYHEAFCYLNLAEFKTARYLFSDIKNSAFFHNAAVFYLAYIDYVEGNYKSALKGFKECNPLTPPSDMAPYYMAQIYYALGNYDLALDMAQRLLKRKNIDTQFVAESNRIAGESLYQLGQRSEAIPYLNAYVSLVNNPLRSATYILGIAKYEEGDYSGAVGSLREVTGADDAMAQSANLFIGQALLKQGDTDGALMAFDKALKMDFDKAVQETAFYNYAVAKFAGGNMPFSNSASTFEEFLRRFPNSSHAEEVQGYVLAGYIADKNYEGALQSVNRMRNPGAQALKAKQHALYMLGSQAMRKGNYATATDYLEQGARLSSYDERTAHEIDLLLGEAYYRTGQYDKSASSLLKYIRSASGNDDNLAMARYDLGYVRYAQKKYGEAQKDFETALSLVDRNSKFSPEFNADILNRLADISYYSSDFSKAYQQYGEALELNPSAGDYPMFQQALMQGYSHDYRSKINTLEEMRRKYPSSVLMPEAMLEITEAKIQLDDNPGAVATYKELISLYPSTPQARQAYLQMGLTQLNMGQNAVAKETYKTLIRKHPSSDEARDAVESMKRITADEGTLDNFISFLNTVPGAPEINASDVEKITFESAEKAFLQKGETDKLDSFVKKYNHGTYTARAYDYLLADAIESDRQADAYSYANALIEGWPDRTATEDAKLYVAKYETARGDYQKARDSWRDLASSASNPGIRLEALEGLLNAVSELSDFDTMKKTADIILSSPNITESQRRNALFAKADALSNTGSVDKAAEIWAELAPNTDDVLGAESAYLYANLLFENGDLQNALANTEALVNSGTPHAFWLAKGFILLSDIFNAQGKKTEAIEYLKALKDNYPGNDHEILDAVDSRLSQLGVNK